VGVCVAAGVGGDGGVGSPATNLIHSVT
jgi:hypothetical protein